MTTPHDKPQPLKPGRYCEHGAVVPGPAQYLFIARSLLRRAPEMAIAASIDYCDICTGIYRRVGQ